jgi:SpoVK/Ycf46/Vps4 family AAA+-type ATPase
MDDGGAEEEHRAFNGVRVKDRAETNVRKLRPAVIATTNRPNALDPALRRPGRFDVEVEIPLPSAKQRLAILRVHARALPLAEDVDLEEVAGNAKGYSGADLAALCREAAMASIRDAAGFSRASSSDGDGGGGGDGSLVTARHFSSAAGKVGASVTRGAALEPSATTWDDVGGLDDVKKRLKQAVEWPLRHAAAFRRLGLAPPRGVLLHGPPGCAKTTLARAAATASGATVIALSAADVFSKYVGEGERALRDAFARARRAAPAVLLLDEIDGMVGNRGEAAAASGSAGGSGDENTGNDVAARVLSAFLVEMDGLEVGGGGDDDDDESRASNVLVVATTNRPASLDVALMRPGRLDMVLYVPPPDARGREAALRVHARGVPLAPDVDLSDVARRAERFTGAELRGVIREAALAALRENMDARAVTAAHVDAALAATRPALAESDLAKWASFRA